MEERLESSLRKKLPHSLPPFTKVYLKWHHQQLDISGYNVFKSVPSNAVFTDTNTTYSAGSGLALSGTQFSIANNGISLAKLALDVGTVAVQSAAPTDDNVKIWAKI